MNSIYHILNRHPAIYAEDMLLEQEELAKALVNSGRMRIDTDYYCNFVPYSDPSNDIHVFFSHEELTNANLTPIIEKTLVNLYKSKNRTLSNSQLTLILSKLKKRAKKLFMVSIETKLKLARIFVQSAHPIVIKWLLLDKAQIFITYSHSIGDVMSIQDWKRAGNNSGMQSTDGSNICIYVSCGGDPMAANNKNNPIHGDGWAALARFQIIAGQEIGHYADIKRDEHGRQLTRHSANFACTMATKHVKEGRINDIKRCKKLLQKMLNNGMSKLIELETKLRFYDQQKIRDIRVIILKIRISIAKYFFTNFAKNNKIHFVKAYIKREKYLGLTLKAMIEDMLTHLSPVADVYKRSNKDAQEAIACVEALARVPQQANKWGYLTTRATMHDLFKVYYKEVIPSLIDNYSKLSGQKYKRSFKRPKKSFKDKVFCLFRLGKYKDRHKFIEVRDV